MCPGPHAQRSHSNHTSGSGTIIILLPIQNFQWNYFLSKKQILIFVIQYIHQAWLQMLCWCSIIHKALPTSEKSKYLFYYPEHEGNKFHTITNYQSMWHHVPQDRNIHQQPQTTYYNQFSWLNSTVLHTLP